MAIRKVSWLVVEGCLLWLFVRFGSTVSAAIGAGLLLIPLASIPVNLAAARDITLELRCESNLRKGETGTLTVSLCGLRRLPALAACRLSMENLLNGQRQSVNLELADHQTITLESSYSGRLRLCVERLRLYDCFGLIGVRVKCGGKCHVTVQPDCFESRITLLPSVNGAVESELYSQERSGWDLTETYQLREYVPGDSPRQIHWKLSGKLDRLIVREPALPIRQDVLLFWERTGVPEDPEILDAEAETLVSLCRALLDASIQFRLGWNDARENRCILHQIRELEDLIGMMPRLLSAAGAQSGDTGAELLLQTAPDTLCSHMVYVAHAPAPEVLQWRSHGHLTILTTGDVAMEGAVRFDKTNYQAQLAMLEL